MFRSSIRKRTSRWAPNRRICERNPHGFGSVPSSLPTYFITPNSKAGKVLNCGLLALKHLLTKLYVCIDICDCAFTTTCSWSWCGFEPILGLRYINQTWMPRLSSTRLTVSGCEKFLAHKKRGRALCAYRPPLCVYVRAQPALLGLFTPFQAPGCATVACPPSPRTPDPQDPTWRAHIFQ